MGLYLNPNPDGFAESVHSEIYVDKTELLTYTNGVLGTEQKFICVSRPRRFGKSMAAKMLSAYYCRTCNTRELFQNLKIATDASFPKHLNQYHVIFLNMQEFLSETSSIKEMLQYLKSCVLRDIKRVYGDTIDFFEGNLVDALKQIHATTGEAFVFIIDEWDCVFRAKKEDQEAQRVYLDFLVLLLKDKAYVKLAYMTGILPIKKYGTHSALNMFYEYSMTEPKALAQYVGFTETEVQALCETYQMNFTEIRRWYDGYQVAEHLHIYNPKSVVEAMLNREYNSYWVNTETYEALQVYINLNMDGLKDAVIAMLGGDSCQIDTGSFQNDMTTLKCRDDVLTLLVHLGYLSYDRNRFEVSVPNEEVRGEFVRAIKNSSQWGEIAHAIQKSKELLEATWSMNCEAVAKALDDVHQEVTSVLTYHNENALNCVISLAYYSARADYTMIREFPTGKGFADIVFLPHQHSDKPAMIVELKWNQSAEGAICQIKEKNYVKALEHYTGEILLVGINYERKSKVHQCVIERYQQ